MNGTEFLRLALKLSAATGEAELRSAVSRAYYGAFHLACDLVASYGIELPASADAHQKLRYCLDASGDADARMASKHLDVLRSDRNISDYDLRDSEPFKQSSISPRIRLALDVEALIARCAASGTSSPLRMKMREYAKQTLRLPVR